MQKASIIKPVELEPRSEHVEVVDKNVELVIISERFMHYQ